MTKREPRLKGLAALRSILGDGSLPDVVPSSTAEAPRREAAPPPPRAVIRYQRKGHGGKEVTMIEALDLAPAALDAWARELKQALGCGGAVKDGAIVLQGDQRPRISGLLAARGVRRIQGDVST